MLIHTAAARVSKTIHPKISFLFQSKNLVPAITSLENLKALGRAMVLNSSSRVLSMMILLPTKQIGFVTFRRYAGLRYLYSTPGHVIHKRPAANSTVVSTAVLRTSSVYMLLRKNHFVDELFQHTFF